MDKYKGIILCEGETDQALIGTYLESTAGWRFLKSKANLPFRDENVWAYCNKDGQFFGIWQVGGNDFERTLKIVLQGAKQDEIVDNIAIVTDHDDEDAEEVRPNRILEVVSATLGVEVPKKNEFISRWASVSYENAFGKTRIKICYILVPLTEVGALETFMMNALSEQSPEQRDVIMQAKDFVKHFSSDKYLKGRREKIKAELGVSLSVFSPDRIFSTMKELLDSVQWNEFDTTNEQFNVLKEL